MEVMIHAVPERMWYVEEFLLPSLQAQGADRVRIWNDTEHRGNLTACMESFAAMDGEGGTWHIQDDVLVARDFVERCRQHDEGVVYGFCNQYFTDDPGQTGRVYMEDAWHSFQVVRIPDAYARECAAWYADGCWRDCPEDELAVLHAANKGDDSFFRAFLLDRHATETALNLKPNLAEHVDLEIGGSVLHPWREYLARAYYWDDTALVDELRAALKARKQGG